MKANLTLFFLMIFVAAAIIGWDWPNIAKIMPVYVAAIPGLALVLVQLYRDATGWEQTRSRASGGMDMDEVSDVKLDRRTEIQRTITYFAWFIGGALGIWLLGLKYSLPLLVFLYGLIEGKEKWITALIMALCAYALVWGVFEYLLETRWPPGILFDR
jgi:tripartite tricarboxylate transporter TctB family protein